METEKLRSIVRAEAGKHLGARLWPNGQGFDVFGWQHCINEEAHGNPWTALLHQDDGSTLYGEGVTVVDARVAARPLAEA